MNANEQLRLALEAAKQEIEWWVGEHGCCKGHEDEVMRQIDAALALPDDGWRAAPQEPTAEMIRDARRACCGLSDAQIVTLYGHMLAAAPVPKAAALAKRPVAFRVRSTLGDWLYVEDEAAAAFQAEQRGTEYQGLFVRDGT